MVYCNGFACIYCNDCQLMGTLLHMITKWGVHTDSDTPVGKLYTYI